MVRYATWHIFDASYRQIKDLNYLFFSNNQLKIQENNMSQNNLSTFYLAVDITLYILNHKRSTERCSGLLIIHWHLIIFLIFQIFFLHISA